MAFWGPGEGLASFVPGILEIRRRLDPAYSLTPRSVLIALQCLSRFMVFSVTFTCRRMVVPVSRTDLDHSSIIMTRIRYV